MPASSAWVIGVPSHEHRVEPRSIGMQPEYGLDVRRDRVGVFFEGHLHMVPAWPERTEVAVWSCDLAVPAHRHVVRQSSHGDPHRRHQWSETTVLRRGGQAHRTQGRGAGSRRYDDATNQSPGAWLRMRKGCGRRGVEPRRKPLG